MSPSNRLGPCLLLTAFAAGCTEGQKQNPLSRATPGAAPAQVSPKPSPPAPAPAGTEPAKAPTARLELEPLDTPRPSLYERLGGDKGVAKIVDAFTVKAAGDEKIAEENRRPFRDGEGNVLKRQLTLQLAQAAGGPRLVGQAETGAVRQALNVPAPEFDALLNDFRQALEGNQVPAADREPLVRVVERLRAEAMGQ